MEWWTLENRIWIHTWPGKLTRNRPQAEEQKNSLPLTLTQSHCVPSHILCVCQHLTQIIFMNSWVKSNFFGGISFLVMKIHTPWKDMCKYSPFISTLHEHWIICSVTCILFLAVYTSIPVLAKRKFWVIYYVLHSVFAPQKWWPKPCFILSLTSKFWQS